MIKKQNFANVAKSQNQHQQSAGVGDYYADPQREVIQWAAIYFEGKFYLSDPYSIAKLQEIQSEIDIQKKLADQFRKSDINKAQSQRSFQKYVDVSSYSCATEKSPEKMRLNQLKAEKELQREQEVYFNKLTQLKNKRKELQMKKGNKNLISVKKEDTKSLKQKRIQPSLHNSNPMHKQTSNNNHQVKNLNTLQTKVVNQPHQELNQLPKQSLVKIHIDQVNFLASNKIDSPTKQLIIKNQSLRLKKTDQRNIIQPTHNQQSIKKTSNNIVQHGFQVKSNTQQSQKAQSIIINNLKTISPNKEKSVNILDSQISNQNEKEINNQGNQERAGNSFFNQIHSQLYKLQHNLDSMQKNPQQQERKVQKANVENRIQSQKSRKGPYKESEILHQTKDILKSINDGANELDQIEQQKQSLTKELNIAEQPSLKEQEKNPVLEEKEEQQVQATVEYKVHLVEAQIPKKKLLFASNIVNYQIAESTKQSSEYNQSEQRQKLQKEITVLQQVVNQLRVQRLKYQVSQNSRFIDPHDDRTMYSGAQLKSINRNLLRLAESPPLKRLEQASHFNATAPNNLNPFNQSAVSEYQNASSLTKYKFQRTKSGKIVKNIIVQAQMAKIQEQFIHQAHGEQKVTQPQEVRIKLQNNQKEEKLTNQIHKAFQQVEISNIQNQSLVKKHQPQMFIKSQPKKQKTFQHLRKEQVKQPSFKIKTVVNNQKLPANPTQNNYNSAATQRPGPSTHKSHPNQPDMESSMPRTLLNNHNHSNPPKIKPAQHQQHLKRRERSLNKELLDNFQQINKKQPNYSTLPPEAMDPKRRASRQGLLKNIQLKTANVVAEEKTSSLKRKICEIQQERKVTPGVQASKEQVKTKNFRTRRESQSVRNSRASLTNKSSKSCGNDNKNKKTQNMVYVPALNPSIHHPLSPKEDTIYQTKFNNIQEKTSINANYDLQKRNIAFTNLKMPVFPAPPHPNITVQTMVQLIKQLGNAVGIQFKDRELHRLIMKKYKNCIMLDLPGDVNAKLVWHYNGKIYLGGWDQEAMQKNGEGLEFIPEKFYYKGDFVRNKRQGYGIMLLFNGTHYEGQWLQGEKHGRGKYQDKSIGLYYEGQWLQGKRNGIGYLQVQGQSIYEGTFQTNYRTGFGSERFSNADFYKGEYQTGKFHGKGIYVWASGASYEGDFFEGLKQGQGKWKSGTGDIYIGQFSQDKKQGLGRFVWQNGCIYQGQFAVDKKNGKGTLKYSDGREVEGLWKDGQMIQTVQVKEQDRQQPLAYRKGQKFQTVTIIKGGDQSGKRFSVSAKLSNF